MQTIFPGRAIGGPIRTASRGTSGSSPASRAARSRSTPPPAKNCPSKSPGHRPGIEPDVVPLDGRALGAWLPDPQQPHALSSVR